MLPPRQRKSSIFFLFITILLVICSSEIKQFGNQKFIKKIIVGENGQITVSFVPMQQDETTSNSQTTKSSSSGTQQPKPATENYSNLLDQIYFSHGKSKNSVTPTNQRNFVENIDTVQTKKINNNIQRFNQRESNSDSVESDNVGSDNVKQSDIVENNTVGSDNVKQSDTVKQSDNVKESDTVKQSQKNTKASGIIELEPRKINIPIPTNTYNIRVNKDSTTSQPNQIKSDQINMDFEDQTPKETQPKEIIQNHQEIKPVDISKIATVKPIQIKQQDKNLRKNNYFWNVGEQKNNIKGWQNWVGGQNNYVRGNTNHLTTQSDKNKVNGNDNYVKGTGNIIDGSGNIIYS